MTTAEKRLIKQIYELDKAWMSGATVSERYSNTARPLGRLLASAQLLEELGYLPESSTPDEPLTDAETAVNTVLNGG